MLGYYVIHVSALVAMDNEKPWITIATILHASCANNVFNAISFALRTNGLSDIRYAIFVQGLVPSFSVGSVRFYCDGYPMNFVGTSATTVPDKILFKHYATRVDYHFFPIKSHGM